MCSLKTIVIPELERRNVEWYVFPANVVERVNDPAIEDAPEALNRLGVNGSSDVLPLGVVNGRVREGLVEGSCSQSIRRCRALPRKRPFHLPARLDGFILFVDDDIGPLQHRVLGNRPPQPDIVRQPQWQRTRRQRGPRRRQLAEHGVSAFAVQHLAFGKVALGGRDYVGVEDDRRAGRFAPQAHRWHGYPELEADHMPAPKHAHVATAWIGDDAVLLKAAPDVLAVALDADPDAFADVIRNRFSV